MWQFLTGGDAAFTELAQRAQRACVVFKDQELPPGMSPVKCVSKPGWLSSSGLWACAATRSVVHMATGCVGQLAAQSAGTGTSSVSLARDSAPR